PQQSGVLAPCARVDHAGGDPTGQVQLRGHRYPILRGLRVESQVSCNEQSRNTTLTFYGCRNTRPSRRRRDLRHPVDGWGRIGCMSTPTREIHLASRPFGWPTHDDFRTVATELADPGAG